MQLDESYSIVLPVQQTPLQITTPTLPNGAVGVAYSCMMQAAGGTPPYSWTLVNAIPDTGAWLSCSTGGLLSGTPGTAEGETVTIRVLDSSPVQLLTQAIYGFTVIGGASLQITTGSPLPPGTVGQPYSLTFSATGGVPPYTWSLVSASPNTGSWLSVNSAGVLSGTPGTAETETITVKVTDSATHTTQSSFSLLVSTAQAIVGINFSSGGVGVNVYEGFPIYQDRIREGGGFTNASSGTPLTPASGLTAAGWPNQDFGANLSQGNSSQSWMVGTWNCGITGTGTETVTAQSGCTVAAITRLSGGRTTFTLTPSGGSTFGFKITGTSGGCTNVFAYMPGQGASTIVSGAYTYSAASLFTPAAITEYKNYAYIRFMHWSNVWFNTAANTSATRRTPGNTVTYQNWSNSGTSSEGYPAEWAVDLCKACGIGIWYCLPVTDDGTYTTSLAQMLFNSTLQRIYLEYGNELWNGTGSAATTFSNAAQAAYPSLGATQAHQQYYADQLNRIGVAVKGIFGAQFGTRVKIVATWQAGNNGSFFLKGSLLYMLNTYGPPFQFIHMLGIAPYMSRDNTWVPGDAVNHVGVQEAIANIEGELTNNGTYRAWIMNSENDAILAMHYNLGLMAYEGRWEIGPESTAGTATNCGPAILDAGMQAVDVNYYQAMFNSGFLTEGFSTFASGVYNGSASAFAPLYQHENSYANYIASGSPRLKAIQQFPNAGSYVPTRNVVSGSGSVIQGVNYADNVAAIGTAGWSPTPTFGHNGFITNSPAGNPYPGPGTVPYGGVPGYVGYYIWCTAPGIYNLAVNFTTTQSGNTNVEYGAPGQVRQIVSAFTIGNGLSNSPIACGTVQLYKGANYVLLGNGTTQAGITVNSLTFTIPGVVFDFYISPTGSDSNAGTLAAPWTINSLSPWSAGAALTNYGKIAGKKIGLLPGTYGVSALMNAAWAAFGNATNGIALDIPGGTSTNPTLIASSNAAGVYTARTATIEANDNGFFGGSNSTAPSMIGQSSKSATRGWVTFDGLILSGASVFCMTLGDIAGVNTAIANGYVVQNCTFTGNSAQNCTSVASGKNVALISLMSARGAVITNNWFHDNFGYTDAEHFSAIYHWGLGAGTAGTQITFNTFKNSAGIQLKENTQYDMNVAYNYIDMSVITPGGQLGNLCPIWGGCEDGNNGAGNPGNNGTLAQFHHNIVIAYTGTASISPGNLGSTFISLWFGNDQGYWSYPVACYNNTMIATSSLNGCGFLASSGGASTQGFVQFYNNGYWTGAFNAVGQYGWFFTNENAFSLIDYNIYGTTPSSGNWANFSANGSQGLGSIAATASSFANFKTMITGATGLDAHSSVNGTNPFTNNGTYALQYQVQSGSPWFQTGKVGGVVAGAAANVGAWDGTATQIGCNFAT